MLLLQLPPPCAHVCMHAATATHSEERVAVAAGASGMRACLSSSGGGWRGGAPHPTVPTYIMQHNAINHTTCTNTVAAGLVVLACAQESIRGCDVFLVQPTCPPVNDHVMELLIMIDACRRASARSITAVLPYYGYARADRKTQVRPSFFLWAIPSAVCAALHAAAAVISCTPPTHSQPQNRTHAIFRSRRGASP